MKFESCNDVGLSYNVIINLFIVFHIYVEHVHSM